MWKRYIRYGFCYFDYQIFGSPKKFLVDNGAEFNNQEFISLCENVNIHICTTAAEVPWSKGLVERHNAILAYTVTKTIDDVKCDLELALAWATAAKNSFKNMNRFNTNQMVFGKNPNFPVNLNSILPALESVTSSQVVADNLNAMQAARQAFIQNESSEKVKRALTHQVRTSGDDTYTTGDLVFHIREYSEQWHGPETAIGQVGKQILVKHGSTYVRVHTCRITHAINSDQTEIYRTNHDYRKNSGNNESKSGQLKSRAIKIESSNEELSKEPVDNSNININAINQNNDTELPVNNNVDDIKEKQGEVNENQLVDYQLMKIQIQEL